MLSLVKFNREDDSVRVFHNFFETKDITYYIIMKCNDWSFLDDKFNELLARKISELRFTDCREAVAKLQNTLISYRKDIADFEYAYIVQSDGYFEAHNTDGFSIIIKHVYRVMNLADYLQSFFRKFKKNPTNCLVPQPFNSHFIIVESEQEDKTIRFLKNKSLSEENMTLYLKRDRKSFALFATSNVELGLLQYLTEKPHRISSILIVLAVFAALVYAFAGGNKFEDELKIQTELIQERIRNLDIEEVEKMLDVELDQLFIPAREIDLIQTDEILFEETITAEPKFDSRNFYLVFSNKIIAYNKRKQEPRWNKIYNKKIIDIEILDFKRLLICFDDNTASAVERDSGILLWETKLETNKKLCSNLKPSQISLEMDRRLNSSLILNPSTKNIQLKTILDGTTLTEFSAVKNIDFISKFDSYNKSVYLVSGKKLISVELKVKN